MPINIIAYFLSNQLSVCLGAITKSNKWGFVQENNIILIHKPQRHLLNWMKKCSLFYLDNTQKADGLCAHRLGTSISPTMTLTPYTQIYKHVYDQLSEMFIVKSVLYKLFVH